MDRFVCCLCLQITVVLSYLMLLMVIADITPSSGTKVPLLCETFDINPKNFYPHELGSPQQHFILFMTVAMRHKNPHLFQHTI